MMITIDPGVQNGDSYPLAVDQCRSWGSIASGRLGARGGFQVATHVSRPVQRYVQDIGTSAQRVHEKCRQRGCYYWHPIIRPVASAASSLNCVPQGVAGL